MDLSSTKEKATAFTKSYGAAMELKLHQPSATNHEIAVALASHYSPSGMVAFTFGTRNEIKNDDAGTAGVELHLDNFVRHGLGVDIRLDQFRIEPVAPGTALCWLTWIIYPPHGSTVESWSWENVYSYREPFLPSGEPSGKGYWEFVVSDNEMAELLKRFPNFFPGR